MVRYLRDSIYQPLGSQLWNPAIPQDVGLGKALPEIPPIFPTPSNGIDPFGPPPTIRAPQPQPVPQRNAPPILPIWPFIRLPSSPGNSSPFGDPPRIPPQPEHPPLEVDPSERNRYNDPDFNPDFLVTDNLAGRVGGVPAGGLLGMLLRATAQQAQIQPDAQFASAPDDVDACGCAPGSCGCSKQVRFLSRRRA